MKTIQTTWEIWTYDVWGNEDDGWEVNDRYCEAIDYQLKLERKVYNAGTDHEFEAASPTKQQLQKVFGLRSQTEIEIDGDDLVIYVSNANDGCPIGEMFCTSHESLCPIRPISQAIRVKRIEPDEFARPRVQNIETGAIYADVSLGDGDWHITTLDGEPAYRLNAELDIIE